VTIDFRVISIGTLAANALWNESREVRTGHATTTLLRADGANVLVDPALPAPALEARLSERTQVRCDEITHVFVTTFTPEHYRGLARFEQAAWLLHEPELEGARSALRAELENATLLRDADLQRQVTNRVALLDRCRPAGDRIVDGIDLFPLPGVTIGTCGLLLPLPTATIMICGDALATIEHIREGKVLQTCADIEQARESFREAIEIADVLVPGRDNVTFNPLRRLL
jgi:glyoxylase-like metal-dependent hydrolase (beta-lactamase superfamily II)